VDELATAFMALKDKRYLPMILKEIVASARRDAGQDVTNELKVYSNPNASRKRQYVSRASALQSVYEAVVDDPAVVHLLPKHVTKQGSSPAEAHPELPGSRPDGETGSTQKSKREDVQAKILASEAMGPNNPIEDADHNSLADLLNSFILNTPSGRTRP
jgi:hypothetical protein